MTTITEIWRFPVKSMQGERLDAADLTDTGIAGDRRWALVDPEGGKVASAKHPRKWGGLLQFLATTIDDTVVTITTPSGATLRSDDPDVDRQLSEAVGRPVQLTSTAPTGASYAMLFPEIDGVAPAEFVAATRTGDEADGTLTQQALGNGFCDVAPLHVVSAATLATLGADSRRLRPNVVIDGGAAYDENEWKLLKLGTTATAAVFMATMRCVMTTLAQPGLDADRGLLKQLAAENRIELGGLGMWACAGAYAAVTTGGSIAVGDAVEVS